MGRLVAGGRVLSACGRPAGTGSVVPAASTASATIGITSFRTPSVVGDHHRRGQRRPRPHVQLWSVQPAPVTTPRTAACSRATAALRRRPRASARPRPGVVLDRGHVVAVADDGGAAEDRDLLEAGGVLGRRQGVVLGRRGVGGRRPLVAHLRSPVGVFAARNDARAVAHELHPLGVADRPEVGRANTCIRRGLAGWRLVGCGAAYGCRSAARRSRRAPRR